MRFRIWAALLAAVWLLPGGAAAAGEAETIPHPIPGDSCAVAEAGDYRYIGTGPDCARCTFRGDLEKTLNACRDGGLLEEDPAAAAEDLTRAVFGDAGHGEHSAPVIMAVHKVTGETEVIFRQQDPDPGSGFRAAAAFGGKLYFAGMGNFAAGLVEVDPATHEARTVYYNNIGNSGVRGGVRDLLVWGDRLLMCLATDDYDGRGTPGGIIMASTDPGAGPDSWRVIADQGDFDELPAVMAADGLNGGGIWDMAAYHGSLYAALVTDREIGGQIHKQGFALYRGDPVPDGGFTWTQVVGDQSAGGYGFGMGMRHCTACRLWVHEGYLYLGTGIDPLGDLARSMVRGDFEPLYDDLDHGICLYRMDEHGQFQMVGGKNDNPGFPDGPAGNLGAGLGNRANRMVRPVGIRGGGMCIGLRDTGAMTCVFARVTDGRLVRPDQADMADRVRMLERELARALRTDDVRLARFLKETMLPETVTGIFQALAGLATEDVPGRDPVPAYRAKLAEFEAFRAQVCTLPDETMPGFQTVYEKAQRLLASLDDILYDETLHNYIYYLGCNYYTGQADRGADLLFSEDGVHFAPIARADVSLCCAEAAQPEIPVKTAATAGATGTPDPTEPVGGQARTGDETGLAHRFAAVILTAGTLCLAVGRKRR